MVVTVYDSRGILEKTMVCTTNRIGSLELGGKGGIGGKAGGGGGNSCTVTTPGSRGGRSSAKSLLLLVDDPYQDVA